MAPIQFQKQQSNMTDISDDGIDPQISDRLHDVMMMIMCPVAGCWGLHGAETTIYYDDDAEAYVLGLRVRIEPEAESAET
jgi:hypothetical protein